MIDPEKITNFNRTPHELEEFWVFCMMVAGKNSDVTARKVNAMFSRAEKDPSFSPLEFIQLGFGSLGDMTAWLQKHRVGQYTRMTAALRMSCALNDRIGLHKATVNDLEEIPGVGPKTSRFFLLHSRPDVEHVALDTHLLKWLWSRGLKTPTTTPSKEKYRKIEQKAIQMIKKAFPGKTLAEADLEIWKSIRHKLKT